MNRRDLLKASSLIPAAGFVKPATSAPARVVWIALCAPADTYIPSRIMPAVEAFTTDQLAKGRKVLGTLRAAQDWSLVALAEEYGTMAEALARSDAMQRTLQAGSEAADHDLGCVFALAAVAPGESFDVAAFLALHGTERLRTRADARPKYFEAQDLRKRIEALEAKVVVDMPVATSGFVQVVGEPTGSGATYQVHKIDGDLEARMNSDGMIRGVLRRAGESARDLLVGKEA